MGCVLSNRPESASLPKDLQAKELEDFLPPLNSGRVIKVYDGDTITIASKIPGLRKSKIYKFSVRLSGIDAPEMKTNDLDEKDFAQRAQEALSNKILGKDVFLINIRKEKYGRILCDVFLQKVNVSEWMLKNRYAVPYDGGKRSPPRSWKAYHENNVI